MYIDIYTYIYMLFSSCTPVVHMYVCMYVYFYYTYVYVYIYMIYSCFTPVLYIICVHNMLFIIIYIYACIDIDTDVDEDFTSV
jgi:hypothetical protein